ncbi:hypothetical protein H2203_006585 [Taxawa tesnikishii (nom. ined.)]|nr:hypothetical protein H2203_006585 [Dothideales sp. JES 119]
MLMGRVAEMIRMRSLNAQALKEGSKTGRRRKTRTGSEPTSLLTPDGVAELRAKWKVEYKDLVMPPPPPAIYPNKEDAVADAKAFAKENNYALVVGHSYKNKAGEINRLLLTCELGGKYRNHHGVTPETRVRNKYSRKTGCPMKIMVQKKRFTSEWVLVIKEVEHNHPIMRQSVVLKAPVLPEIDEAVYDWHMAEQARGEMIHGNTLKAKALALDWLNQYRLRYKLPGKMVAGRSGTPGQQNHQAPSGNTSAPPLDTPYSKEHETFANVQDILPNDALIMPIKNFVKNYMSSPGFALAQHILERERDHFSGGQYDVQLVLLAALMHDVGDHKYQKPEENPENQIAEALLEQGADPVLAMKVQLVCKNVSYSNEVKNPRMMRAVLDTHPELGVVQDADRLDAIGVIGIGRTFTFGGAKQPNRDMEGTLRHFVDKLERLEGMMKTETGKRMARERTQRLRVFRQWWDEENFLQV